MLASWRKCVTTPLFGPYATHAETRTISDVTLLEDTCSSRHLEMFETRFDFVLT